MDQKLGCNSKSWSLDFSDSLCLFQHNKFSVEIHTPMPHRVGVYLNHSAGTLTFYCISLADDTMILLHREQTTFTQPLYPGFWVGLGSTLKLCQTFSFSAQLCILCSHFLSMDSSPKNQKHVICSPLCCIRVFLLWLVIVETKLPMQHNKKQRSDLDVSFCWNDHSHFWVNLPFKQ